MAQPVERPTPAQDVISRFVSSSPALGSVRSARSLEPALDSVSVSLCPSPLALRLSAATDTAAFKRNCVTYNSQEEKACPPRRATCWSPRGGREAEGTRGKMDTSLYRYSGEKRLGGNNTPLGRRRDTDVEDAADGFVIRFSCVGENAAFPRWGRVSGVSPVI